jgi:DNA polymerase-3 subunit epsilon
MTKPILAALIAVAVVVPGLTAAVVLADLPEGSRATVVSALSAQITVLELGLVVLVGAIAALGWLAWRQQRRAEANLAAEIDVIAHGNPRHRLAGAGVLATSVNALAEQHHTAEERLAADVASAHRELRTERDALLAVLAGLDVPVGVIDDAGRVLLVNPAARRALSATGRRRPIAAGRSIFSVFDVDDFAPVLQLAVAGQRPTARVLDMTIRLLRITGEAEPAKVLVIGEPHGDHDDGDAGPAIGLSSDLAREHRGGPAAPLTASTPLSEVTFTVVDCETTGLHAVAGDRLVAVAAVRVDAGVVRNEDTFDELVNPGRPIPDASIAIHGITEEMVVGARSAADVVSDFAAFAESSVLVGHHLAFDAGFLEPAAAKAGVELPPQTLDTMLLSAVLATEPDARHGLDAVSARYGIDIVGRHTALGDALATAEVLVRMVAALQRRGIVTLGQAQEAARATDLARRIAAAE